MAVTEEFKQDVLEVLSEYTAQLENQSGQNATPIMPAEDADKTVSMPAVKFDQDPRVSDRAKPVGYYQIPVGDFFDIVNAAADHVEEETADLADLKDRTEQARQATVTATAEAAAATAAAETVNATLVGMTITITDRHGDSRSTDIGFDIYNTYASRAEMMADAANVPKGKFVMIATDKGVDPTRPIGPGNPLDPDNATLWGRNDYPADDPDPEHLPFTFLSDLDQASSSAWAEWMETFKPIIEADHATAVADHTQAGQDHTQAESDHTRAESDHTTAGSDHTQAGTDHTRAESDHTTAGSDHTRAESDHTQAGNDHTRAESDHTRNENDHLQYTTDHQTAVSDHQTAQLDHQTAGSDHDRAEGDHTTAGQDHTQATTDHGRAEADHTQAESDHTRAESDHTTAGDDHTTAGQDHTQAESDHTRAEGDHTTAGSDHTRAEGDHGRADGDHTQAGDDHEATTAAASAANTEADRAKDYNDHPWEIRDDGHIYVWDEDTRQMVQTEKMIIGFDEITPEQQAAMVQEFLSRLTFDETPTAGSPNAVTSRGIKAALDLKQDTLTFADGTLCQAAAAEVEFS